MSRPPWQDITIRETAYGPEIVFDGGVSGWIVPNTEDDTWVLEKVLKARRLAKLDVYLIAKNHYEQLVIDWGKTMIPGDPPTAVMKQAEAELDALKEAAGYGGPDDPECCQRYSKLHEPAVARPECRWYRALA